MLKFGKKPARPNSVSLKFGDVLNEAKLPTPPKTFGHETMLHTWSMFANDQWGDCVFAGAAHEHMLWTAEGEGIAAKFTTKNVLADYSAVTGFDPSRPDSDQGTDMQTAAAYRQKTGVVDSTGKRHKIDAYAALRVGDTAQLATAVWLFNAVGVGVECPASMEDQFSAGQVWDVVPGDKIDGGHYIPCVGRNSEGNFVFVSWGKLQAATPEWVAKYMDEGICYFDVEMINTTTKVSLENFNADALTTYLRGLT